MFTAEQLFIWNVEQLLIYHKNPTPENLFASVGPLRRLLLDETPLIHLANRSARLKFLFVMEDPPDFPIKRPRKEMNLDKFLAEPIAYIQGQWVTVRDLISYVRNYAGLEHKTTPDTDAMKALEASGTSGILIGGMPPNLYSLGPIIGITLHACRLLYKKLKENEPG
jgi:hypothetical protein